MCGSSYFTYCFPKKNVLCLWNLIRIYPFWCIGFGICLVWKDETKKISITKLSTATHFLEVGSRGLRFCVCVVFILENLFVYFAEIRVQIWFSGYFWDCLYYIWLHVKRNMDGRFHGINSQFCCGWELEVEGRHSGCLGGMMSAWAAMSLSCVHNISHTAINSEYWQDLLSLETLKPVFYF